jgi:hypothetical protein
LADGFAMKPTSHAAMSGGWAVTGRRRGEGDHPPQRGREERAGLHKRSAEDRGYAPAVACLGLDGQGVADPAFETKVSRRLSLNWKRSAYGRERQRIEPDRQSGAVGKKR